MHPVSRRYGIVPSFGSGKASPKGCDMASHAPLPDQICYTASMLAVALRGLMADLRGLD
jgi:hypothetical protein